MLIAITGSSDSGKSTFAIKTAKELSHYKKNVAIVFTDYYTPSFVTFFPEETEDGSLGKLLAQPVITKEMIQSQMNTVSGENYIVFLGYKAKENKNIYANYTKQKAEDLIIQLKHIVDVVIVDCQTCIYEDIFSLTAIEMSDIKMNFTKADLKGLSYYKSNIPLFSDYGNWLQVVNDTDNSNLSREVADEIGRVDFMLPYTQELGIQFLEERLLHGLGRKGKEYENTIVKVIKSLNIGN